MRRTTRVVTTTVAAIALFAVGATMISLRGAGAPTIASFPVGRELPVSTVLPPGDLPTTIANLQERLRAFPQDERSAAALGLAFVQQARVTADPSLYPLAELALRRSLTTGGADDPDALVGMGTLALARHEFAEALGWGMRARTVAPFDADVYGVIGDAQIELGRYREAFRTIQRMVNTRPDLASYARVSYARELRGDVRGAVAAMREALRAAGTPTDEAWASFQLGELAFSGGHVRAAAGWYRWARDLAPEYVPPSAGLAKVAWAGGDLRMAIARYRHVVARYPAPEYLIALADLYRTTGRRRLAQRTEALVRAEERLFLTSGVNVDLDLALFDADHGRSTAALAAAQAEWRRRQGVQVADALAWALSQAGRNRAAARIMERALLLGTRNALFVFHDAMIHLRLGERRAAETLLRRAVEINPNFSIQYREPAAALLRRMETS